MGELGERTFRCSELDELFGRRVSVSVSVSLSLGDGSCQEEPVLLLFVVWGGGLEPERSRGRSKSMEESRLCVLCESVA